MPQFPELVRSTQQLLPVMAAETAAKHSEITPAAAPVSRHVPRTHVLKNSSTQELWSNPGRHRSISTNLFQCWSELAKQHPDRPIVGEHRVRLWPSVVECCSLSVSATPHLLWRGISEPLQGSISACLSRGRCSWSASRAICLRASSLPRPPEMLRCSRGFRGLMTQPASAL